jgi:hypothetical protein
MLGSSVRDMPAAVLVLLVLLLLLLLVLVAQSAAACGCSTAVSPLLAPGIHAAAGRQPPALDQISRTSERIAGV